MNLPIAKFNNYDLLSVSEELYLKTMKGKIIKMEDLEYEVAREETLIEPRYRDYHLIIRIINDSNRKDDILLIETVIH